MVAAFVGSSVVQRLPHVKRTSARRLSVTVASLELDPKGGVTTPKGFRATGEAVGFKPSGGLDLAVIVAEQVCAAAGVFTTNIVCAPPVTVCKNKLAATSGRAQAVIINSGQANAATGEVGTKNALLTAEIAAQTLGIDPKYVLVASTGVIGKQIDMQKMEEALPGLVRRATVEGGDLAAKAIMTTDLSPKQVAVRVQLDSGTISVGGICKGSGMIHPDMATMLGFVTTDADVDPTIWSQMLKQATRRSFNQITVDGDTSTNDSVLALASGAAGVSIRSNGDRELLQNALNTCCEYLAKTVARDGEGATILLEAKVSGAQSEEDAAKIARTIVASSLVKSAIFGRDPNWGRIAAAAGRAGVAFSQEQLGVFLGSFEMMRNGQPIPYDTSAASAYLRSAAEGAYLSGEDTVNISVTVGDGPGTSTAWGCDLSFDYVKINAEYTT